MRFVLYIDDRLRYDSDLFLGEEGIKNLKLLLNGMTLYEIQEASEEEKKDFEAKRRREECKK